MSTNSRNSRSIHSLLDSNRVHSAMEEELSKMRISALEAENLELREEVEAAFLQFDKLKSSLRNCTIRERQLLEMLYQTRNQLESYAKLLESSNRSLMDVTEESIEEEDDDGSIMGVMERTLTESRFPNTESDEGNSTFEASIVVRPLENEDIDESYEIINLANYLSSPERLNSISRVKRCRNGIRRASMRLLHKPSATFSAHRSVPNTTALNSFALVELNDEIQDHQIALARLNEEFLEDNCNSTTRSRLHFEIDLELTSIRIKSTKMIELQNGNC